MATILFLILVCCTHIAHPEQRQTAEVNTTEKIIINGIRELKQKAARHFCICPEFQS